MVSRRHSISNRKFGLITCGDIFLQEDSPNLGTLLRDNPSESDKKTDKHDILSSQN